MRNGPARQEGRNPSRDRTAEVQVAQPPDRDRGEHERHGLGELHDERRKLAPSVKSWELILSADNFQEWGWPKGHDD